MRRETFWFILVHVYVISFVQCQSTTITFKPKPRSQDVTEGRSALLLCGVVGTEAKYYQISWLYEGKDLKNNTRRYQKENNLLFKKIDRNLDSGKFQCLARHNITRKEKVTLPPAEFNIRWLSAGNVGLILPTQPSEILPGVQVEMSCNITGNPIPRNVVWYRDGKIINKQEEGVEMKGRRLRIKSTQLVTHDGVYNCCISQHPLGSACTPKGGEMHFHVVDPRIPVLIRGPENKIVAKGSSVQLHCSFQANPAPIIWWTRDGISYKKLNNQPKNGQCNRRCIFPNGTLTLNNVRESAFGTYHCRAQQAGDDTRVSEAASATLKKAYIRSFEDAHKYRYVEEGDNVEFNCEKPDALPMANITWLRNGKVIDSMHHVSQIKDTLVIDKMQVSDKGNYTCRAENIAGRVTKLITLAMGSKPTFQTLTSQSVLEGSNVTWMCPVSGFPDPTVTWYKNNRKVTSISDKMIMDGKSMTILQVNADDRSDYYCSAENGVNPSGRSNSAQLIIEESFKFFPDLHDVCIEAGQYKEIECKVQGNKLPTIVWRKLNNSNATEVNQVKSSTWVQSLIFNSARASDSGFYQCSANTSSATIATKIYINVGSRPKITISPQNLTVFEGSRVTLDCATQSDNAKVVWQYKDQSYNQSTDSILKVLSNGSLVIPHPRTSDYGIYRCSYSFNSNCDFKTTATAELTVVADDFPPDTDLPMTSTPLPTQLVQTIALSVSGGIAYILVTIALIIYCRGKRKSNKKSGSSQEEEQMLNGSSCNGHPRGNHDDEMIKVANGVPMEELSRLDPKVSSLLYPVSNIEPITIIGKGEFGDIFLSKAPGLFPDLEEDILVMVKVFKPQSCADDSSINNGHAPSVTALRSEFNREVNLLHRANHENVVKLLAVCKKELKPDHLVTEYLEWGILKLCLEASKEKKIAKFTKNHKMSMCCQIACGVEHLNKLGLIHKDLATRNCVVSSQLLVKISMLCLTREGFENEYHDYKGRRLPVRWQPPEVLFENSYSTKSDVWSFGVSCWEIFTLGEIPYENLSNEKYISAQQSEDPPSLPALQNSKRITSLITKCCHRLPNERPDIRQITKKLQSIIGSGDAPDDTVKTKAVVTAEMSDVLTEDQDES